MKRIPTTSVRNSGKTYDDMHSKMAWYRDLFGDVFFVRSCVLVTLNQEKNPIENDVVPVFWWTEILLCWNIILSVGQWDKQPVWCKFWAKYSMSHHPRAKQVTRTTRNTPAASQGNAVKRSFTGEKNVLLQLVSMVFHWYSHCPVTMYLFCLLVANYPPKKILEMESFLRCANLGSVRPPSQFFWRNPKRKRCLKRRLNSNSQKQLYVNDEMYTNIYIYT